MRVKFRFPLRHPFYPDLPATPVRAARSRCSVLSGSVEELARASKAGVRVERAVFVLQRPDRPFLSDPERDTLWHMFEVPVFTLLLDDAGRLVGYECEAQAGLHVGPETDHDGPWDEGMLDSSPCECGRPGHRLRSQ